MSSHAERQKKYLAKLNGRIGENQYKERVETSQIEKVRKSRFDKRQKDRAQQKRYQERKNVGKTTITSPANKTTNTLTRAIHKAEASLQNSPSERSQLVRKLFEETCSSTSRSPAKTLDRSLFSQELQR